LRKDRFAGGPGVVMFEAMFQIDSAFAGSSHALGDLALSHVRLQADVRFPWIVLVPRRVEARELEDLAPGERDVLMVEILRAGAAVRAVGQALGWPVEKLNVGQLGNLTPQLHIHVVGRRADDAAWPGPVWGWGEAAAYGAPALATAMTAARESLGL
jgi:diadenosine tetraphosphate (Ap4A) HIT family hydrolase